MAKHAPLTVNVIRGDSIESRHHVHAVAMNSKSEVLETFGDAELMMFPRSAIKMIQALILVESGAYKKFDLDLRHLALACASHHGEEIHTTLVNEWLQKLDLTAQNLVCGAHWPSDDIRSREMAKLDIKPSKLHNNCSGKHTGFLTVAKTLGMPIEGYEKYDHPLQVALRQVFTDLSSVNYDKVAWGIDGCSIPTYFVPLKSMASALATFLPGANQPAARKEAMALLLKAMSKHPELVGGSHDSYCTEIGQLTHGKVIAKIGAEGVYAAIVPELDLVIAIKAEDGAFRACETSVATLVNYFVEQKKAGKEFSIPQKLSSPTQKNWAGEEVGKIQVVIS
jgi:L-asparaginase II